MDDYTVALKNGQWRIQNPAKPDVYADAVQLLNVNAELKLLPKTDPNAKQAGVIEVYGVELQLGPTGAAILYGVV